MVGLQECLVARKWGHGGFHTEGLETHCRQLAWFEQSPGQWAGHLGWFILDAVVGTDGGVVCYLHIQCQSWHGLRWYLYCWHLQAALWLCMLHCTARNWCCWWSSPLGARLLLLHSLLQQWTGLCTGVFSLFWLWQLVILSPFMIFEMGMMLGCLWTSGVRAVAFRLPVTLFATTFTCHICVYQEGVDGCSWGTMSRKSAAWDHVPGGCAYSMYCWTCTHCSHSWFNSVVCSADL